MVNRNQLDREYAKFGRKINNFLRNNTSYSIHGVARQGSRTNGTYNNSSDLDIFFAISGNPSKQEIYPDLVEKLQKIMKLDAEIGGSYNIINIQKGDLDIDLVLLTITSFESQCLNSRYRRITS